MHFCSKSKEPQRQTGTLLQGKDSSSLYVEILKLSPNHFDTNKKTQYRIRDFVLVIVYDSIQFTNQLKRKIFSLKEGYV